MNTTPRLFDNLVAASGLHGLVAPFTISRLLLRAGVQADELTPHTLMRALPTLEHGLGVYLHGTELHCARAAIRRVAAY